MEYDLSELKKDYEVLKKKYSLPKFEDLNEDFIIEKIDAKSDVLLKIIRKIILDKIYNIASFFDNLFSGQGVPRFYYSYLKNSTEEDKKKINDIYSKFGQLIKESLVLEAKSSEKDEADFVNKCYSVWRECQKDLIEITKKVAQENGSSTNEKRERSYFG